MRCGIYGRVSTKDGRQEVENQLSELRRFADSQGWQVYREYVDHETGGTDDRTEFRNLFEDASRRRFDVVVFWALDRFTREGVLETLTHLNRLSGYGVGFRSYTEAYLDSCGMFKDAVISILATIAKQEHVRIGERTKAGLQRARERGKILGRPRIDVHPPTVAFLRAQGLSWDAIAKELGCGRGTVVRAFEGIPKKVSVMLPVIAVESAAEIRA